MRNKKIPKPGSKEAIAEGCTCRVDALKEGTVIYHIMPTCPIHSPKIERVFVTNE